MAPERNLLLPVIDPPRSSDESLFKGSGMTTRGAYAALSYMLCAVFLVMFNKAALSSYSFPSANVITLLQMISSISLLYVLKHWKIITFIVSDPWPSTDSGNFVRPKTLLHTLPLSLAYLLYMLAGMESIRGVNVPMYTTLRRTTVVLTMIVEYLLVGQKYSLSIVGSVALIIFGVFVAGARDLSFDTHGYVIVLLSNITTAIYLTTIARIGKSSGLNSFGLMWCNGLVTLLEMANDVKRAANRPEPCYNRVLFDVLVSMQGGQKSGCWGPENLGSGDPTNMEKILSLALFAGRILVEDFPVIAETTPGLAERISAIAG